MPAEMKKSQTAQPAGPGRGRLVRHHLQHRGKIPRRGRPDAALGLQALGPERVVGLMGCAGIRAAGSQPRLGEGRLAVAVKRQVDGASYLVQAGLASLRQPDDGELVLDRRPVQVLHHPAEMAGRDEVVAAPIVVVAVEVEDVMTGACDQAAEPTGVIVTTENRDTLVLPPARQILRRIGGGVGRRDEREESTHGYWLNCICAAVPVLVGPVPETVCEE